LGLAFELIFYTKTPPNTRGKILGVGKQRNLWYNDENGLYASKNSRPNRPILSGGISMPKTKKKPNSSPDSLLRGFTAVAIAAAALFVIVFVLVSRPDSPSGGHTLPTAPHHSDPNPTDGSSLPQNPYTADDFTYENGYLTCTAGEAMLGVDVSAHQGEIDWRAVADSGMEFAMVRIGYRGYTSGGIYGDEYAHTNLTGAKEAGLKVGAYFYSQALNPTEAALEAAYCISLLDGYEIDMPVVFDWEYVSAEARTGSMDGPTLLACTQTFCQAIQDAGYQPMVYFNPTLAETLLDLKALDEYPFWLAMYSDRMTWPYRVDMWQYTASGSVPGISGDTDINLWFVK
jgi:GH25 family lysozyme M1 (1,4-beta-N-acetylmuramidase)